MKEKLGFLVVLLSALAPALAHASVAYPGELKKRWEVEVLPGPAPYCTLCHLSDAGGTGTATTPFGRALLRSGTLGNNVASLDGALDALDAAASDSDSDGVSDRDELQAGLSPNEGDPIDGSDPDPLANVPLPRTGCSVRPPLTSTTSAWALAVSALLAARRRSARLAGRARARRRTRVAAAAR